MQSCKDATLQMTATPSLRFVVVYDSIKKKKKGSFLTGFQLPAGYFQNTYLITGSLVLLVLSVDVVGSLCDVVCKFWKTGSTKKKKKKKVIFTTFLQLKVTQYTLEIL